MASITRDDARMIALFLIGDTSAEELASMNSGGNIPVDGQPPINWRIVDGTCWVGVRGFDVIELHAAWESLRELHQSPGQQFDMFREAA